MDEAGLITKLLKIEALHAGATTDGEREAAAQARDRIIDRLTQFERVERAVEYQLSLPDPWARRVFMALARRYGLEPYRYKRQRYSTVMIRVVPSFLDGTLWPEFQAISAELRTYLDQVTRRVISEAIHADSSEASERAGRLSRSK